MMYQRPWPQQRKQLHTVSMYALVLFATLAVASGASVVLTGPKLNEGDPCKHDNYVGKCVKTSECHTLNDYLKKEVLAVHEVPHCNFHVYEEIICCPVTAMSNLEIPDDEVRNDADTETGEKNADIPTNLSLHEIFQTNVDYVKTEGGLNASLDPVFMSASGRNSDLAPVTTKKVRSSSTVPDCTPNIGLLDRRSGLQQHDRRNVRPCRESTQRRESKNLYEKDAHGNWQIHVSKGNSVFKTDEDYLDTKENQYRPNDVPHENRKSKQTESEVEFKQVMDRMEHGNDCSAKLYVGKCEFVSECRTYERLLDTKLYVEDDIIRCSFGTREEIICCPYENVVKDAEAKVIFRKSIKTTTTTTTTEAPIRHVNVNTYGNKNDAAVEMSDELEYIIKKFPYVAAVGFQDDAFQVTEYCCGGVLLAPNYFVVPSNCFGFDPNATAYAVMVGVPSYADFILSDSNEPGRRTTEGDITMYNILEEINPTEFHRSACIYNNYMQLPTDVTFSVTHWNRDKEKYVKGDLMETPVQIVDTAQCSENYKNYAGNSTEANYRSAHICVSVEDNGGTTDNLCELGVTGIGSALNIFYPNGTACVLAITTPMRTCQQDGPILFTALGYYKDFIDRVETTEIVDDYET